MRCKAHYEIVRETPSYILIRDLGTCLSITNDAENVVRKLFADGLLEPERLLYYIDTNGEVDQLEHDGKKFIGFKPGGPDGKR